MTSSEQMSTPETTALIVVDMQTAFTSAAGALAVAGADRVVGAVNARIAAATGHGWPVFFTRDVEPAEGPVDQFALDPALDQRGGAIVPKGPGTAGGFSGFVLGAAPGDGGLGPLAERLRRSGASAVLVVGLAADVCVAATARDAHRLGYRVTVDLDASAFVHAHPRGDGAAVAELVDAGIAVVGTRP